MKFLSDEWFELMLANVRQEFSKPGKLTLTYCEIFKDCPGDTDTKWFTIDLVNGVVTGTSFGSGEAPNAEYRGIAVYPDHIRMCKGELNPKKAVLDGTITIEDSVKAGAMRTLQLASMYNRLIDCKKIPGVEY